MGNLNINLSRTSITLLYVLLYDEDDANSIKSVYSSSKNQNKVVILPNVWSNMKPIENIQFKFELVQHNLNFEN